MAVLSVSTVGCASQPSAAAGDATPTTPRSGGDGRPAPASGQVQASAPTRPTTAPAPPAAPLTPAERARWLAQRVIIVDGHIDVPYRLYSRRDEHGRVTEDIAGPTAGNFDYPRARAGGLDAPFFSIYVPVSYQKSGGAKAMADELIDMVEGFTRAAPDKFALAPSPDAVRANAAAGKISLAMGIENGAALEGKLANVAHFHARGVRYITLTHTKDNDLADSSAGGHRWGGLSPLGVKVVREMNRVGIMVDVAHVSDETFYDVMKTTAVPVIASHSSCRSFTPSYGRNMTDDMIRALGKNGGVIMINFGSSFIRKESRAYFSSARSALARHARQHKLGEDSPEMQAFRDQYVKEHPPKFADVAGVVDHIDHVVKLVGIDHVGLGSDFDGLGDTLADGLKDVSQYPNLLAELVARGYTDEQIEKICGGNALRVWQAVEDYAAKVR